MGPKYCVAFAAPSLPPSLPPCLRVSVSPCPPPFGTVQNGPRSVLLLLPAGGTLSPLAPFPFPPSQPPVAFVGLNDLTLDTLCSLPRALAPSFPLYVHPHTRSKTKNQRCAFFGHCDHKIEKVQEGHRLTLTYILRYDPADKGIADEMREGMGAAAVPPVPPAGGEGWVNSTLVPSGRIRSPTACFSTLGTWRQHGVLNAW